MPKGYAFPKANNRPARVGRLWTGCGMDSFVNVFEYVGFCFNVHATTTAAGRCKLHTLLMDYAGKLY